METEWVEPDLFHTFTILADPVAIRASSELKHNVLRGGDGRGGEGGGGERGRGGGVYSR